ncbi:uncharacterized protein LOC117582973 [Drosophila guanche]|uniref:uncharacterized protein LOC117582973 n=1 Tax=Drosophila guanche TaxID=7266 RepID=UPI0014713598|nr:uncharacterized protein LOC117582973 [Drosophila guanche]
MGQERQVSLTVESIMALFGLILLLHQAPSIAEGQQGEKRIEADMYRMAKDMESGQRISAFQSQSIVNQFQKLGEHIKKETSGKRAPTQINGKPGQTYSIFFEFSKRKHPTRRSS